MSVVLQAVQWDLGNKKGTEDGQSLPLVFFMYIYNIIILCSWSRTFKFKILLTFLLLTMHMTINSTTKLINY